MEESIIFSMLYLKKSAAAAIKQRVPEFNGGSLWRKLLRPEHKGPIQEPHWTIRPGLGLHAARGKHTLMVQPRASSLSP